MNFASWTQLRLLGFVFLVPFSCSALAELKGKIAIDGSSTVAPIMMAAAEMFRSTAPKVHVTVGVSGTGGGFKKFLDERPDLRMDISDASRPIKPSEIELAKKRGIEFIEIPIALDGIAVVVHPSNKFCDSLTVAELKRIWSPESNIQNWRQIRPTFPDLPLKLYGPGTDSGTFDYFTEMVVGTAKASRSDYTASESDNVLVQGVAGDPGSLGYFGYSYFEVNKDKLKVLSIDSGSGTPIAPSVEAIRTGTYSPLSRPLFLYVNKRSYARAEVRDFLNFLLERAPTIVEHPKVQYIALSSELYQIARRRLEAGTVGTVFGGEHDDPTKSLMERYGGR